MFLWHLSALMIAAITLLPLGFPQPDVGTLSWWVLRPVWLAILCAVTALFVYLLGRFERPGRVERSNNGSGGAAAVAVTFVIVGVCGFAVSGLVDLAVPNGRQLIALPVSPLINVAALVVGGLVFWWRARRPVTTTGVS